MTMKEKQLDHKWREYTINKDKMELLHQLSIQIQLGMRCKTVKGIHL
jgi:hypothetical protein